MRSFASTLRTAVTLPSLAALLSAGLTLTAHAQATAPSVALAINAGNATVSSVPAGTAVTLTANVANLQHGMVRFCDVSTLKFCTHENRVGHAQLTQNGSASVSLTPGPGVHAYVAALYGQRVFQFQVSPVLPLTVVPAARTPGNTGSSLSGLPVASGAMISTTSVTQSGSVGNYTLSATVKATGATAPSGSVSFVDQTTNKVLGSAALGPVTSGFNLLSNTLPLAATMAGKASVAVGDFNHDGKMDFATVGSDGTSVNIMLGNGDGTFTASPVAMLPINGIYQIKVADFNQDGNPDLVLVNLLNNQLDFLLGNGDGTFRQGTEIYAGGGPIGVTLGDFNGDGVMDIMRVNTYAGTVTLLTGNGDGTFTSGWSTYVDYQNPTTAVTGDFNGDGKMDFAVTILNGAAVQVYLNNGDGTFTTGARLAVGNNPGFIQAGDFNGDGKLDLAVTNQADNTVSILLGNGDGTFTNKQTVATPAGTVDLAVADFNGDGKLDLVVSGSTANTASILLGNGDGTFTASATAPAGINPYQLAVADFNGDGAMDIVAADNTDSATVVLAGVSNTATATLSGVSLTGGGVHNVTAVYSGDTTYANSSSGTVNLQGQAAASTTRLYVGYPVSIFGQQVPLTAVIASGAGVASPNGERVTFLVDGKAVGSAVLNSGSATLNTTSIPAGFHALSAVYAGDASLTASTGAAQALVIRLF